KTGKACLAQILSFRLFSRQISKKPIEFRNIFRGKVFMRLNSINRIGLCPKKKNHPTGFLRKQSYGDLVKNFPRNQAYNCLKSSKLIKKQKSRRQFAFGTSLTNQKYNYHEMIIIFLKSIIMPMYFKSFPEKKYTIIKI